MPVDDVSGAGRRRALTLDWIVDAAVAVIDEQGVQAASMRAVAGRLGFRVMALYRYVPSRAALSEAVVERVLSELDHDPSVLTPVLGWRLYLGALAQGVRRCACAHPRAFPLVAGRAPSAPWIIPPLRSLRWVEAMFSALTAAGFSDEQVQFAYRAFNSFLLGSLVLETSAMALRDPTRRDGSCAAGSPRDVRDRSGLAGEINPTAQATVHRLGVGLAVDCWQADFESGLHELLDRIAVFVAATARSFA